MPKMSPMQWTVVGVLAFVIVVGVSLAIPQSRQWVFGLFGASKNDKTAAATSTPTTTEPVSKEPAAADGDTAAAVVPEYSWHEPGRPQLTSTKFPGRTTGRNGALFMKTGVAQAEFVRSTRGARQRAVLDQQFYDLAANPPIRQRPDTQFGSVPGLILTGRDSRSIMIAPPSTLYAEPAQRFSLTAPTAVVNPAHTSGASASTTAQALGYGKPPGLGNNTTMQKSARDEVAAKSMGLTVVGQKRHALVDAQVTQRERRKAMMASARERALALTPGATRGLVSSSSDVAAATQFYNAALKSPGNIAGQLASNAAYHPVGGKYSRT